MNVEAKDYLDSLNNEDILLRASNIIALGKAGDCAAAEHLVRILEDKHEVEWLRACAAIALGRIASEDGLQSLIKALQDNGALVARAAISALGDLKCQAAVPHLERVLRDPGRKELHPATINALGAIGGREVIPALLQALEKADSGVKRNAAFALGGLRCAEAVQPLLRLMKQNDEGLRAVTASALGLIGDRRAVQSLTEALNDSSDTVRAIAASSLEYLDRVNN